MKDSRLPFQIVPLSFVLERKGMKRRVRAVFMRPDVCLRGLIDARNQWPELPLGRALGQFSGVAVFSEWAQF